MPGNPGLVVHGRKGLTLYMSAHSRARVVGCTCTRTHQLQCESVDGRQVVGSKYLRLELKEHGCCAAWRGRPPHRLTQLLTHLRKDIGVACLDGRPSGRHILVRHLLGTRWILLPWAPRASIPPPVPSPPLPPVAPPGLNPVGSRLIWP